MHCPAAPCFNLDLEIPVADECAMAVPRRYQVAEIRIPTECGFRKPASIDTSEIRFDSGECLEALKGFQTSISTSTKLAPRPQVLKKLLFQYAARLNEQAAIDRLV